MNYDATVTSYFEASGDLLAAILKAIKTDDPKTYKALHKAIAGGATMTLSGTVGATRVVEVQCTVNFADQQVQLFHLNGQAPTVN